MGDIIEADSAAGARLVFGDDRLSQRIAKFLSQHPAGEIDDTAGVERDDQMNGSRRKFSARAGATATAAAPTRTARVRLI